MKKLSRILLTLLVVITTILSTVGEVFALDAPQTITVNTTTPTKKGYIVAQDSKNQVSFGKKTLTDNTIAYCLEYNKKTPLTTTVNKIGEMDAGIVYILENGYGYSNKSITGDSDKDYYITQAAIWWYLDETMPSLTPNLPESFKTTDSDPEGLREKIKTLVENAKVAKNKGYKNPKMTASGKTKQLSLSDNQKYYISEEITVTLTDLENYNVSISNAPEGSYITDKNGNKKNTFNANETFRVYVPSDKVDKTKNTSDIEVSITSETTYNKAYRYSSNDDEEQDILPVLLYPTTVTATAKVNFNITNKKSQVKIIKIDAETKKPLKGAVLVIKDESGKVIAEFTTTEKEYVMDNIPNGKYTVEEIKAPNGYELSDKKYSFTIDDENRSYTLSFENYPSIDIPDTNSNISIIMYILGTLITISGVSFIKYNAKKQK